MSTTTTTTTTNSTDSNNVGERITKDNMESVCNTYRDDWPDWRKHLYHNGWAVVRDVIPTERCKVYSDSFWDWIENFNTGVKRNSKKSWETGSWPSSIHGILQNYAFGQNQFVWDIRSEQPIIDVFTQVYNTDQLLVSFDGGNLSKPVKKQDKDWYHFDQGSNKFGFRCVQGFLNLNDCQDNDGGLILYQGSHLKHDQYFTETGIDSKGDWYKFEVEPNELSYFKDCKKIKVNCNIGDIVLWDSRTIHYACAPTSDKCRMVVYVSYQPASLISEADLAKKINCFNEKRMTSHWAAENIKMFAKNPRTFGDSDVINKFRYDEGRLPTLTPRAQQLAGLVPYENQFEDQYE
ncbi:hypothetical protein PPL_01649 [Heterostelium album PN500]|uniref:Phytanoyl-CoA dioxygenase n=1 Tax=Heterostelium pallidum (strain ATCC 26659 / Pp 5 / PN500) TaxID=670386 RepID=D3B035_HETP5|nr:hypothetical protein PPL_01649 [Heterostelium album PN500]EFA84659.1 hypothetical protein PPL_01649 [Heterostelium album PN500]|eukprot:XP_020436772.1 hypothetical protein PPL_01649 [Heterostelium album PN500]